ncbi:hypothetical protein PPSIR1_26236 [Plesiocystis pacifica SIR-1]|uniref:Pentapeptide repeat family protein n=1 Tax=Plesiocystis pacifica SIR-1 TaxID=391625 RepID=A6GFZ1_9BACT|nr:pentapeptide repeat-containing protein [Plesiocystis pacifica]EDM75236.1 hypothetical protein PPSIR1_26236 [Plesiocystis pacifica SIR-1]
MSDLDPVQAQARDQLLTDVKAFNAWREANPDFELDLSNADLRGANLRGALLASAKLDGARLDDVALAGASLAGASFVGASLLRADLRGADFGHATLFNAKLNGTALGARLAYAADLTDASLVAARAMGANFSECRLEGADLTDCDLRGAKLSRTMYADVELELPPSLDDEGEDDGRFWARFSELPLEIREGLALFTGMVFIGAGQQDAHGPLLANIVHTLGFDQASFSALMPSGQINLDAMVIAPPESPWIQRVWLALMCGMAGAGQLNNTVLHVIGHFGEQLGFCDRATARIMGEELGIEISAKSP